MTVRNTFKEMLAGIQRFARSLFKGGDRLFRPTDDDYPATGVQSFEGEITR